MSNNSNFFGSLTRDRKDVSRAIAKDLALLAYEGWQDQVRSIDKKIREVKSSLNAMRDAAYTDPLMIALKKQQSLNVDEEIVNKRCNLLLELKELKDARRIIGNDRFFSIPAEDFTEEGDEYDDILFGTDDEAATAVANTEK